MVSLYNGLSRQVVALDRLFFIRKVNLHYYDVMVSLEVGLSRQVASFDRLIYTLLWCNGLIRSWSLWTGGLIWQVNLIRSTLL